MKSFKIFLSVFGLAAALQGHAQTEPFLSAETPENLFNLGVRVGLNSSNRTFSKNYFQDWNVNSWGTGVDAGVVLNLNMRDVFAIQPGFFYESRSGNYAYAQTYMYKGEPQNNTQLGHYRVYNFAVPIMASFRFNITDNLRWIVEAGPYFQFKLNATDANKVQVIEPSTANTSAMTWDYAKSNFFDFGVKMGTGLQLWRRYSVNVHYMAGTSAVWKAPFEGGRNKAWVFSLGYDF